MAKRAGKGTSRAAGESKRGKGARVEGDDGQLPMGDIRHPGAKRKNNPPAKIAAEGSAPLLPKAEYAYNPHLPPVLRFDQHGNPDALPDLIAKARQGPLSEDEARVLAAALRKHEPWLEWTGKRETPGFAVDPVALHIHERVSAQAILKVAARQDVSKGLFADPEQEYHEAVQFYKHEIDWSNRLILGDSLQVMSSLARREDLAGKVQMIYMDPPYGIKFASNFQPEVGKRDVKDKQEDLTREPEMVRAYRDTWHLGIHSYLSYLRDRLIVARELLADTGSIFVQISDENLHHVLETLDEVFGGANRVGVVSFKKTTSQTTSLIGAVCDYILWYARDVSQVKYRRLYSHKVSGEAGATEYKRVEFADGQMRSLTAEELNDASRLPVGGRVFATGDITSAENRGEGSAPVDLPGGFRLVCPSNRHWSSGGRGTQRLWMAGRLLPHTGMRIYKRCLQDFAVVELNSLWADTRGEPDPQYVVQTSTTAIERCLLMTTDPGDLVLDPTCGSGTTAYVAEQWGRRWITADTSRVAVAIARQRLLTAKFDSYKTKGTRPDSGGRPIPDPASGFIYKTVPHITLKSIAQNVALDPIFARHEPKLEAALKAANDALVGAIKKDAGLRTKLAGKLAKKEKDEGKRAVTDADRRRWVLPPENRDQKVKLTVDAKFAGWYHWEVPFDTDPEWPRGLQEAVLAYRAAWRVKMDEVNACIASSAEQEELVDQPEVIRGITRVSGPFTVEAVQPPELSLGDELDVPAEGFGGEPEEVEGKFVLREVSRVNELEAANVGAYLDQMVRFLRADGVRFLNNKQMKWTKLEPLFEAGGASGFHAEGRWTAVGDPHGDKDPDGRCNVAVVFGPQYGPVTGPVVIEAVRQGHIRGYEHVVIAGFNFDGAAQTAFDQQAHPKVKLHLAHIRPDINPGMDGLLKESVKPGSGQLFTVFGLPRVRVEGPDERGEFVVEMEGVDIYNPVDDSIRSCDAGKVAAWFLDGDYDGRTFCVTQAFFPDRGAWEKLARALNGKDGPIDAERFEAFSGTRSLAFPAGKHRCVAVKVIDPRGNEVMAVERLTEGAGPKGGRR